VIANVCSGAAARSPDRRQPRLFVPPTAEGRRRALSERRPRDGPRTSPKRANCSMIWYNGAGTVWLLGNRAAGAPPHAEGNAPAATIVSVGETDSSPEAFPDHGEAHSSPRTICQSCF
jgi:hypothetical protein